jgi:pimeloyl-ACP methyl ester carboxylesterase
MRQWFDKFWHRRLGRPYKLKKVIDEGRGLPVVLLHGIGRTGSVWNHVVEELKGLPYRAVAFDLLGFGRSPKPDWLDYGVDDHARAVIHSLQKLHAKQPMILVGHSMGCLVAVRVARLRPDLVRHLVLYEMPLYEGLPQKRVYRLRTNLYRRISDKILNYKPTFDNTNLRRTERLARKIAGFEVSRDTWEPFVRSLRNTIVKQTTAVDIKNLKMPMDVIYGRLDMYVIRGKPQEIFGADTENIVAHTIRARHEISPKASRFLVKRILAATLGAKAEEKHG